MGTDDSHSVSTSHNHQRVVSPLPGVGFPTGMGVGGGPRSTSANSNGPLTNPMAGGSIRPHPSFATSPLSESDAASISAAYRSALAHPEFERLGEGEGESPPTEDEGEGGGERMRRELEREGIGLRGVPGGKGRTVD